MKNEFDIIEQYFNCQLLTSQRIDIIKSIGDDCAIIKPEAGKFLVLSTDTLIEGVHFPKNTSAKDIAYKALAVNLSDLAAMGAKPAWFTLALTLTDSIDESWINDFSQQLHALANDYAIILVGGDTTRATTLSITIQVHGYIEQQAMLRSNAKMGDIILLSGEIGAAALGLKIALNDYSPDWPEISKSDKQQALKALNRPQPEIKKGLIAVQYSQSAIDISDGLLADLGHILKQSQCAAQIYLDKIPLAGCLQSLDKNKAFLLALTGGDDYKLCITMSTVAWQKFQKDKPEIAQTGFYPIGKIYSGHGITLLDASQQNIMELDGTKLENLSQGYNHFSE
ncbi:MAG: thiamine-phosphate kinase [Pseudomonadota bacterium]